MVGASGCSRRAGPIVLACLALLCSPFARAQEYLLPDSVYQLDNTLQVPGTGLHLGGYATASFDRPREDRSRVSIDNFSLFLWWEGDGPWKFFSEIDYQNLISSHRFGGESYDEIQNGNRYLSLERAYFDYALNDTTNVRIGKYLTPIGYWNLIHATPLVWTTSRPLVTTMPFPTNMTGAMVSSTLPTFGQEVEYSLYGSDGSDVRTNPDLNPFSRALGGHINIPLAADGHIGMSYADFDQEQFLSERVRLVGLDFLFRINRFEFSGEGIYRYSNLGPEWDEKGAFVQAVAPLSDNLYAVARYETYRRGLDDSSIRLWVAGLTYRATSTLVFKAEWINATNNYLAAPVGFLSSISILF